MGIDQNEARRQRAVDKPKLSNKHPIAAIEKRVIGSPAFADLSFSARAVLLLLACNLEKNRNGHVQLSESQAAKNGIERKTLRRALTDLVSHGFILMTWRGGKVQGSCNKYALTWLPIKDRQGIHCDHFKLDSWRIWRSSQCNKTECLKCPQDSAQNVPLKRISIPKISPTPGDKKGLIEVIAIPNKNTATVSAGAVGWIPGYLSRLSAHGLVGQAIARGEHPRHAAYQGREVSTDFAMRGDSKALGFLYDTVMFLRPAVVSLDRLYRGVAHDPNRVAIAAKTAALAAASVALYLHNKDDPRYADLPGWDRDANWHFFIGDQHFRWPKIWEIGAVSSAAERSVEKLMATDPERPTSRRGEALGACREESFRHQ